jgi:hypothetical protein
MTARIAPANAPCSPEVQSALERRMPTSVAPLTLFTTPMLEVLRPAGDYRTIVISPTLSGFHQKPSAPVFRGLDGPLWAASPRVDTIT